MLGIELSAATQAITAIVIILAMLVMFIRET